VSPATLAAALAYEDAPAVRRADPPASAVIAPGPQDVRGEPDASAVTMAEDALLHSMAMRAMPLKRLEIIAGPAIAVPEHALSTHAESADEARDDELGMATGPRECRPEAGIVTECIFN
jgi:hypothetical protein